MQRKQPQNQIKVRILYLLSVLQMGQTSVSLLPPSPPNIHQMIVSKSYVWFCSRVPSFPTSTNDFWMGSVVKRIALKKDSARHRLALQVHVLAFTDIASVEAAIAHAYINNVATIDSEPTSFPTIFTFQAKIEQAN